MRRLFKIISVILFFLFCIKVYAEDHASLNLAGANLSETIYLFAKLMKKNIIISPNIQGTVALNLENTKLQDAFQLLLMTHGLSQWKTGNTWLIAPRVELIQYQQEELKWREVQEATSVLQTEVWPIHYGKAEDIAHILQEDHAGLMSKRGRVRVDTRTNTLCVEDVPEKIVKLYRLVKRLDVPTKQIMIEARLASVDSDFERELGLDFSQKNRSATKAEVNEKNHYSLAVVKLADDSLLDIKLAALENEGHAELISSPSLFSANQQSASIEAGEEVPYQEVSESGGTAVTFKKAVLGLKVTPQVLPNNQVLLQLQISQDRPSNRMVLGVPTISTRQIMTNVLVKDRHTIVLGGIYETNREKGEERIPFLSALPIVGELFKVRLHRDNKRELLIFVTPKIMT